MVTPKERELITRAELVARYVNDEKKIIGVSSQMENAKKANSSKAIKELIKLFGYKIQMLIPHQK